MNKIKILTIALIILAFKVSAESYVYITDQLDLPIRSDIEFGNNIFVYFHLELSSLYYRVLRMDGLKFSLMTQ